MGKKRKDVKIIVISDKKEEESDCPKCFGNKEDYCKPELCGEKWFKSCKVQES